MAAIILPRKWTKPPQHVSGVSDSRLKFAWAACDWDTDQAQGNRVTSTTGVTRQDDKRGFNSTASGAGVVQFPGAPYKSSGDLTVMFVGVASSAATFCAMELQGGGDQLWWGFYPTGLDFSLRGVVNVQQTISGGINGKLFNVAMVYARAAQTVNFYYNAPETLGYESVGSQSAGAAPIQSAGSTLLLNRDDGSYPYTGAFYMHAVWPMQLDQGEIYDKLQNPWQVFRARPRRLYFGAAAGGSVGAATGASVVKGVYGYIAKSISASVVSGVSATGSIGNAVGTSTAKAIEGYVARATSASNAQALEGYIGRATGASVVSGVPLNGSVGTAAGHSNVLGVAGFVAKATSASVANAARGSIGRAVGTSNATAYSAAGSVGSAVGSSVVNGTSIFAPTGRGIAIGSSTAVALALGRTLGIGDFPVPRSIVTQGDVTPAMRQWMVNVEIALSSLVSNLQSPLAAKGDLWSFDSANNRLPVGTTGYGLRANSFAPMGMSWDGLLVPTPGTNGYVLTADSGKPLGYAWEVLTMPTSGTWRLFAPAAGTSGNWTVPSDVDTVYATMIGGGGAGNGSLTGSTGGGGGGSGEYCYRFPVFVTPGGSVAYAVGSAGLGATGAIGGNGTGTSFGAFSVAPGWGSSGSGGNGGGRSGVAGSSSTGGDAVSEGAFFWGGAAGGGPGAAGGASEEFAGNSAHSGGGSGASSPFGQGGAGGASGPNSANGGNAGGAGAGGGGAYRSATPVAGGNGGPGALYVEYFSAT